MQGLRQSMLPARRRQSALRTKCCIVGICEQNGGLWVSAPPLKSMVSSAEELPCEQQLCNACAPCISARTSCVSTRASCISARASRISAGGSCISPACQMATCQQGSCLLNLQQPRVGCHAAPSIAQTRRPGARRSRGCVWCYLGSCPACERRRASGAKELGKHCCAPYITLMLPAPKVDKTQHMG
eukprot:866444-Pelagomonas_calceolata.AAC.1